MSTATKGYERDEPRRLNRRRDSGDENSGNEMEKTFNRV